MLVSTHVARQIAVVLQLVSEEVFWYVAEKLLRYKLIFVSIIDFFPIFVGFLVGC